MIRLKQWMQKETVLILATVLALLSCIWIPPGIHTLRSIDGKVLSCLFCLMIVVCGLEKVHLMEWAAVRILKSMHSTRAVCAALVFIPFVSSMFMTNDVALLTFVPLAIAVLGMSGQVHMTALTVVLQTVGANLGSTLTPVGNPQNLYLYTHYGMTPGSFIGGVWPIVVLGGLLLGACCFLVPRFMVEVKESVEIRLEQKGRLGIYTALFGVAVLSVFGILSYWVALAVVVITVLLTDRKLFLQVDYALLFTFVAFFVFVGNLSAIPQVQHFFEILLKGRVMLVAALCSQFISNVPAAVLLSRFTGEAVPLLRGVDIGGCGTLIASLASLIAYRIFIRAKLESPRRFLRLFAVFNGLFLVFLLGAMMLMGMD